MLQAIEAALREVQEPVFYGSADDVGNAALWNYIVFFRDRRARNQNNSGYTDYFIIAIIHENWVPSEMIDAVIERMETLPGIRLANTDISFDYTRKPGTNAVIEVATLTFAHARKRV